MAHEKAIDWKLADAAAKQDDINAADEEKLAALGYKQELKRGLSALTNFGVSFCILSFPTGVVGSFATAWFWGGPVTAVWGWIIVSIMICSTVGMGMAELCSAYPTSGGLYYWAAKIGGKHGRFASWMTGWFNLLGQISITSSVAMAATNAIVLLAVMVTCPSRLNRHGGIALASVQASALHPQTFRLDPCPVDANSNIITSALAYLNGTDGTVYYQDGSGPVTDVYGSPQTSIAYDDAQCLKQPFNPTQPQVYGIFLGIMGLYAIINCCSIGLMNKLLTLSIFWHIFGSLVIIIGLPVAARGYSEMTRGMLFTRFQPGNWDASYNHGVTGTQTIFMGHTANNNINGGGNGISATDHSHAFAGAFPEVLVTDSTSATHHTNNLYLSGKQATTLSPANPYIFFCGMLMSQWSFTGYDASAHMVEETRNAAVAGPKGIIRALTINSAFGFAFIIAIVSSVPDYMNSFFGPLALNYNPVAQIIFDVFEERLGDGRLGGGFFGIITVTIFLCGVSCLTSNARMLYAFARDDAVPGSKIWHVVNERFGIPTNAVLGMALAAALIALPIVYSTTAYAAVTSITTIGLYISYVVPMFFRIFNRKEFVPGPFFLGQKLSLAVHSIACAWVVLICVIFVLPNTYPINMELNFNYAIIAVGVVLSYSLGTWFIPGPRPLNAKVWFRGPNINALNLDVQLDGGPGASVHGAAEAAKLGVPFFV